MTSPAELESLIQQVQPAARFVSRREMQSFGESPQWHAGELLLTPPDWIGEHTARNYSRLLFRAELRKLLPSQFPLPPAVDREAKLVLSMEHRLPEQYQPDDAAKAFLEYYFELHEFDPEALPLTFPLLKCDAALRKLHTELRVAELAKRCTLPHTEVKLPVRPVIAVADEAAARKQLAIGNFAKAAAIGRDTPVGDQALALLAGKLAAILEGDTSAEDWRVALWPLRVAASLRFWPRETRALYELQRIVSDFSESLDAVAPVDAILSLFRKPVRRSLEPVRDVIIQRRLRAALRHIDRSELNDLDRHALEQLLEREIEHCDCRIRERLGPVIRTAFDEAGVCPANVPEQIARDAIIAQLLDRLSETGFLRLGDLRDAVARNDLKLHDCTIRDVLRGDKIHSVDRRLHEALFGVYRRGELYLQAVQRFSGLAFGTRLGRWLTLFVALPYGGAFLAIEAVKHIGHAISALAMILYHLVGKPSEIASHEHHEHSPMFDSQMLALIGGIGTFFLVMIHIPTVRQRVLKGILALGDRLRALPIALWRSRFVQWLLNNDITRFLGVYILGPLAVAISVMLVLLILGLGTHYVLGVGGIAFAVTLLIALTPAGQRLRQDCIDYCYDFGRRLIGDLIPGLFYSVLWFFRELLSALERLLYAIDEWFRYRQGQSKPSLALKVIAGLVWFPVAYVFRFVFYLLAEPQVNPIKHFPVVTVSHKVLLPMVPSVAQAFAITKETALLLVSGVPGIFGFLVWEFKENWKLYAANRSPVFQPVQLGHHGESMRGLLKPGFHSGTIPKLFRRFRRAFKDYDTVKVDRLHHEQHHLQESVRRWVERSLLASWNQMPEVAKHTPRLEAIRLSVQRVEIDIRANTDEPLMLSFENFDGTIAGTIDSAGWTRGTDIGLGLRALFAQGSVAERVSWNDWCRQWANGIIRACP